MTTGRVYRRHLNALRYCARGSRAFFERHGFSWSDFLRNGIEREKFMATGDAMALKCVELADQEAADGRRG